MALSACRARILARRMLTCAAVGLACGAVLGGLYVLVGWLPGAMATYAENPHFVDPRRIVLTWCLTFATVGGVVGLVIGLVVGAFRAVALRPD